MNLFYFLFSILSLNSVTHCVTIIIIECDKAFQCLHHFEVPKKLSKFFVYFEEEVENDRDTFNNDSSYAISDKVQMKQTANKKELTVFSLLQITNSLYVYNALDNH